MKEERPRGPHTHRGVAYTSNGPLKLTGVQLARDLKESSYNSDSRPGPSLVPDDQQVKEGKVSSAQRRKAEGGRSRKGRTVFAGTSRAEKGHVSDML